MKPDNHSLAVRKQLEPEDEEFLLFGAMRISVQDNKFVAFVIILGILFFFIASEILCKIFSCGACCDLSSRPSSSVAPTANYVFSRPDSTDVMVEELSIEGSELERKLDLEVAAIFGAEQDSEAEHRSCKGDIPDILASQEEVLVSAPGGMVVTVCRQPPTPSPTPSLVSTKRSLSLDTTSLDTIYMEEEITDNILQEEENCNFINEKDNLPTKKEDELEKKQDKEQRKERKTEENQQEDKKHEYKNGKQEYKEEESGKEQKIEVDEEQVKPTKQALEEGGLEEEAGEEVQVQEEEEEHQQNNEGQWHNEEQEGELTSKNAVQHDIVSTGPLTSSHADQLEMTESKEGMDKVITGLVTGEEEISNENYNYQKQLINEKIGKCVPLEQSDGRSSHSNGKTGKFGNSLTHKKKLGDIHERENVYYLRRVEGNSKINLVGESNSKTEGKCDDSPAQFSGDDKLRLFVSSEEEEGENEICDDEGLGRSGGSSGFSLFFSNGISTTNSSASPSLHCPSPHSISHSLPTPPSSPPLLVPLTSSLLLARSRNDKLLGINAR